MTEPFFCQEEKKSVTVPETPNARLTKFFWSRPHAHERRSKSPLCTDGPFTQAHVAHVRKRFPSKLAAYARWMEQACKAVQRWKNRSWVERRRTQGTEGDLCQAKFCKNAGAPQSCHLECHHEEMAPCPSEQLGVPPALVLFGLVDGLPWPATPRHAPTCQRRDDGGVNGDSLASPEWKAVGDDLNPALVICYTSNSSPHMQSANGPQLKMWSPDMQAAS